MKTFIIILILFLSFQLFSQEKIRLDLKLSDLHPDSIISKYFEGQIKHPSETNIFKNRESRTIVNKSILDNGFLLIEELWQYWEGTSWTNSGKYINNYDGSDNLMESLYQNWDGSNWKNFWKDTHSYDGNNNLIGYLEQDWVGMDWVNIGKGIYTYATIDGIDKSSALVNRYKLSDNYPNPFNPSTTIKYQIPKTDLEILKVYDVLGKEVTTLVNKEQPADEYEIKFEANGLPSGIYFYRIQAGNFSQTKKMMLLK